MKRLFLLVTALIMGVSLNAQVLKIGEFGIKAGMNVTNLSNAFDSRTAFYAGLTYEYPIGDNWAFAPEFIFSSQGTKLKASGDYTKLVSSYANIPILAKFYLFDKLSFEFGPQLGFLMSAKEKTKVDGDKSTYTYDNDDTNTFDLAITVGASFHVTSSLYVNMRYNLGLTNMLDEDFYGDNKNRIFQLGFGYKF